MIKNLRFVGASICIASMSTGCLSARFFTPSRGSVTLQVDGDAVGEYKPFLKALRLTLKSKNALKPESISKEFAIDSATMSMEGVPVGSVEANLEVLSNSNTVVGSANKEFKISTGDNQISFDDVKVDVRVLTELLVNVNIQMPAEYKAAIAAAKTRKLTFTRNAKDEKTVDLLASSSAAVALPTALQSLLEDNCVSCHDSVAASAKLDLLNYPFKSAKIGDQTALMNLIRDRIKNTARPMPTDGLMAANDIALFDGFLASALQPAATGTAASDSLTVSLAAQAGETLDGKIIIKDANDLPILEGKLTPVTVVKDLRWSEVKEWKQIPLPTGQVTVRARLVPNN